MTSTDQPTQPTPEQPAAAYTTSTCVDGHHASCNGVVHIAMVGQPFADARRDPCGCACHRVERVRLDYDVEHAATLAPSEYMRARSDADLVIFGPLIGRHVMQGDLDAARFTGLEYALWRDSQMTSAERIASYEAMRFAA